MDGLTTAQLDEMLGVLRKHGVRAFDGAGLRVSFFDAHPVPRPVPHAAAAAPGEVERMVEQIGEAALCACGHDKVTEHNEAGECIADTCPADVCARPVKDRGGAS